MKFLSSDMHEGLAHIIRALHILIYLFAAEKLTYVLEKAKHLYTFVT